MDEELSRAVAALQAADAAGDTAAATELAGFIRQRQAGATVPQEGTAPARDAQSKAIRAVAAPIAGFGNSAAETLASPAELFWAGARKLGLSDRPAGQATETMKRLLMPTRDGGQRFEAETTGEKLLEGAGKGVADAGAFLAPAAGAARLGAAGGLTQRVGAAAAAQPVAQAAVGAIGGGVGEATDSPLAGGAAALTAAVAPSAIRSTIGRAISPIRPGPGMSAAERNRLAQAAEAEGLRLDPGQLTGSKPLNTTMAVLKEMPLTGMADDVARQQAAFNRAVLRRAGEPNADAATPEVIDGAFRRLGGEFERLASRTTVRIDTPQVRGDLQDVVDNYLQNLGTDQANIFRNKVRSILDEGPAIPGATYQKARSRLGAQAKSVAGTDPELSQALRGLRDTLDRAAEASITDPILRQAWQRTRRQYANLKTISKAVSSGSAGAASGDISGAQLWGAQKAGTGADQMARGSGDLNELARIGQAFVKPQTPNSGTAQRGMIQSLLSGGVGATAGALSGDPMMALLTTGGALATPAAVARFLRSDAGRRWLTNQRGANLPRVGPTVNRGLLGMIAAERAKEPATGLLNDRR